MKKIIAFCLALCLCMSLAACTGAADGTTTTAPQQDQLYTIQVSAAVGNLPSDIQYYIYRDTEHLTGVAAYGMLDASGKILFSGKPQEYALVLEMPEEGYQLQEKYLFTEPTLDITLSTGIIKGKEPFKIEEKNNTQVLVPYSIDDIMRDFTFTDTDGKEYVLSELFEKDGYKAVVLNFWNIDCNPCKAEFPYLQQAYERYSEDILVLGMNPVDKNNDEIAEFKRTFGLTFPLGACDTKWIQAMARQGNPTTVIIDRYGRICVKETGAIPEEGIFESVFAHFAAEDYEQELIFDMEDFAAKKLGKRHLP